MARCDDIGPLLSAFSDGELSRLETDQVTLHLDSCEKCRETLVDFVLLGHHLRTAVSMPSMEGFTEGVMSGIARTRRPLRDRLLYRLEQLRERWVAAVSLAGAAVAMAALVLVLAVPRTASKVSSLIQSPFNTAQIAQNQPTKLTPSAPAPAVEASAPAVEASNSQTFISRLRARHPAVATWSEPDYKTTVIWLGDDTSGND